MKPLDRVQRRAQLGALKIIGLIALLLLIAACGSPQEEPPAQTATPQVLATTSTEPAAGTPVPTPTPAPTRTATPQPASPTPTSQALSTVVAAPESPPSDTPAPPPPPPPTDTPTVTPRPMSGVEQSKIIYHDAEIVMNDIARYPSNSPPWMDLLVQIGGVWYGPERQEDDISAAPLPEGYYWTVTNSFATMLNGEAWWTGPGVSGEATLIGPDGVVLVTLPLRIEFY